jgi:hypothetical protein
MPHGQLVAVDHVGGEQQHQVVVRRQVLSETHTIRLVFHDFENIPHNNPRILTKSSALLCHGYQWRLELYPGGGVQSNTNSVYTSSLALCCVSVESADCQVKAKVTVRLVPLRNDFLFDREHIFCNGESSCRPIRCIARANVLNPDLGFLVDGNLTIEVDIQVYKDESPFWGPKNELHLDMLGLLESAKESGDVKFQVGPEEFLAHRPILEVRAPELAALTKDYPSDTPIPIHDIKPSAFRSLLRFVYANDVPKPEELKNEAARELLDVANRFGCKGLKLAAEAELAASGITVDTAADMIMLGDAKNCALLKEAAMGFFASNPTSVISSPGWGKVEESLTLMKELMVVLAGNKTNSAPVDSDELDYKRMCVSSLRRRLEEKGLDIDGSREVLIRRLEEGDNEDGSGN